MNPMFSLIAPMLLVWIWVPWLPSAAIEGLAGRQLAPAAKTKDHA